MQTYSHILIAAGLSQPLSLWVSSKYREFPQVKASALIFGSLLPDLALILIAIVCLIRDKIVGVLDSSLWSNHDHNSPANPDLLNASWTASLFDDWFFNNPVIITLQNTFHSPLLLLIFIVLAFYLFKTKETTIDINAKGIISYEWLFWMCFAAMLHTLIDIPLHAGDGPLIAFPVDWSYRFNSSLSYWDPNHHGDIWSIFEHTLDVIIILYLLWSWKLKKRLIKH